MLLRSGLCFANVSYLISRKERNYSPKIEIVFILSFESPFPDFEASGLEKSTGTSGSFSLSSSSSEIRSGIPDTGLGSSLDDEWWLGDPLDPRDGQE